jgi:hypothetical protein
VLEPWSARIPDQLRYVSVEDGDRAAATAYTALRPAVAQFGTAGRFLVISSPSGETGWFSEHWHRAYRGELEGWSWAQASTAEMNPAISADFLAQVERDESDTFGSEYMALFESGGNAFFDLSRFAADPVLEPALPDEAASWTMGLDPAFSGDSFGYALLGRSSKGRLVVGPVGAIAPRFRRGWTFDVKRQETDRVLADVAALAREYRARAWSDQHQSQAIEQRLKSLGVSAQIIGLTREIKTKAFRELRDRLYEGSLALPDHPDLFDELRRVRLRIDQGGARIVLPRSSKGHCDMTQALAVAAYKLRFDPPASGRTRAIGGGVSLTSDGMGSIEQERF